mmetsp:Transcript_43684/g.42201  ORF Transcript_43684/g.42201 Transcript_43684/m.42201 type:complete len:126 (+) Transcript_43684:895-1272(+)
MFLMGVNSLLEFIAESMKKDSQLSCMLVKTTKLLPQIYTLLQTLFDLSQKEGHNLRNKGLLIIFIDKVVKVLHLALLHPMEYTLDSLKKFLFERKASDQNSEPRNWIYLIQMFRIINQISMSSLF